jgi:hypothetical protein
MARRKTETRVSDPPAVVSPVLAAADLANEGTGAPRQDYDFALHLAENWGAKAFFCGEAVDSSRAVPTVLAHDHPAACRKCLGLRESLRGKYQSPQPFIVWKPA